MWQILNILVGVGGNAYGYWMFVHQILSIGAPLDVIMVPVFFGDVAVTFLHVVPMLVVALLILRIITRKKEWVPGKIRRYLRINLYAAIVSYSAACYLCGQGLTFDTLGGLAFSAVLDGVYFTVWLAYLNRSSRVKGYYGAVST